MKKYYIIIAALFAIAAVSCQKELAAPDNKDAEQQEQTITPSGNAVVFTATMPENPLGKTAIGAPDGSGNYQPLWTVNDSIIVNGVKSGPAQLIDGGLSAKFVVEGVTPPYVALGPSTKFENLIYDGENKTCSYLFSGAGSPQRHNPDWTVPTYSPGQSIIAAYSADSQDLTFHHLCSYYKITVDAANSKDHENIRYIYIRQGDGSMTAGFWIATYSNESSITIAPSEVSGRTLSSVVTYDCGTEGLPQGSTVIVSVPAYDYPNGLYITLKDVSGHFVTYLMKPEKTKFGTNPGSIVEFNPAFSPAAGHIKTAEDWDAFVSAMISSNDFNRYRWVGNDTVKLDADISTTNLRKVSKDFKYTFDGQGHIITQSGATSALFSSVSGTVKNLNLAGSLSSNANICSSLTENLYAGGRVERCTTSVNITNTSSTYVRAAGLVGVMNGGTISKCKNSGSITASATAGTTTYNFQVAGIVAQVYVADASYGGNALIEDCINSGAITADPSIASKDVYFQYVGVGGIAGWLRGQGHSFTLDNCDNEGAITYSAEHVTSTSGAKASAICVGGIVGNAGGDLSSVGAIQTGDATGIDVNILNCDNEGTVYNCGDNYSNSTSINNKVFTGGIAGSLLGTSSKAAVLSYCANTGTVLTYDRTGDDSSSRPLYCQVAGGLIGYGGYVSVDHCTVNCTIGNGKRPSYAVAGALGLAVRTFSVTNSSVWSTLKFVRGSSTNNINSAQIAVVPMGWGSNATTPIPSMSGSVISSTSCGASFYYRNDDGTTGDQSTSLTGPSALNAQSNIVRGGYSKGTNYSTLTTDFTLSSITYLSAAPAQ